MIDLKQIWPLTKKAAGEWSEDKASRLAAALAYYTALSLAPLLVLSVKVIGWITNNSDNARDAVVAQMQQLMGGAGKDMAQQIIEHGSKPGTGIFATVISVVLLLVGASGVFGELQDSMNTIWEVQPRKLGLWGTIQNRFLSLAMVFGVCFLLLVSLVVSTVISGLSTRLTGGAQFIGHALDLLLSVAIVACLFAAIFKFLPDIKMPWRHVWLGAILTSVLFTLGKFLLGIYLSKGSTTSAYGAAGSLAAVLVWVYYSAQILFFGAEFTQVYAYAHGFKPRLEPYAEPVTEEQRAQQGLTRKEDHAQPAPPPRIVAITRPGHVETKKGAVIAGAGILTGMALGAAGMFLARVDKRANTITINERLNRLEKRFGGWRGWLQFNKELDFTDRVKELERKIRRKVSV